jgi:hypothetical protein
MLGCKQKSVRWATLLMMAASLAVSASRVVHAHVDGAHSHLLRTPCDDGRCHVEPVAWHMHVWLLGREFHVPVAGHDDLDSHHPPAEFSASWSDLPTITEVHPPASFVLEASLDCLVELAVSPQLPLDVGRDCPPHSGLSPGTAQRIWMSSLTL